jgi:uncharacterized protein (TIGR02117 family)
MLVRHVIVTLWLALTATSADAATIHVVSNGWHTGLVLARADIPPDRIPELADVGDAAYVEFGWGDREYYPHPRPTVGMALSAALTPSPSVVQVAGVSKEPAEARPGFEVVAITLEPDAFAALVDGLEAAFDRPSDGPALPVARGFYADSRFYAARGEFHLFNTCNTWVARQLEGAGVAITADGVVTAEDLMSQLRGAPTPQRARSPER